MKYAWIENDRIRDISPGNPAECYTPEIAAHYSTEVPDDAQNGWIKDGDTWAAPPTPPVPPEPEPPEPVVMYPKITPVQFKMLFTSAERIAIKAAKTTDPVLEDAFEILEDPRLTEVDLGINSNQDLLLYMVSNGLITDARRMEILTGKLQ